MTRSDEYRKASEWFDTLDKGHNNPICGCHHYKQKQTIRRALRIAGMLEVEPNKSVITAGVDVREAGGGCTDIFKAMVAELIKQAEKESEG